MIKTGRGVYKNGNLKLLVTEIDKERSEKAKKRQLKLLEKGIDMGKIEDFKRAELHEK